MLDLISKEELQPFRDYTSNADIIHKLTGVLDATNVVSVIDTDVKNLRKLKKELARLNAIKEAY